LGRRSFLLFPALLLVSAAGAVEMSDKDLSVAGYVDGGRFYLAEKSISGEIMSRMGAKWIIDKKIDDNWSVMANLHWLFWRNQATDIKAFHIAGLKFDADLQGKITYASGAHRVQGGLYEFKYNPDSKNLGEYLLRSEAYPTILESSQGKDFMAHSSSRVAGVEYDLDFGAFRQTALLYAEQYNIPMNDISAAYLAAVGSQKAELGFGVAYHRFLSLGEKINTSLIAPEQVAYIEQQGLETKAIKLSLHGRLDFGAILEMEDNFKLYGEVALLGLKNDTLYYKNMNQRMPKMMGLDIPTGKILNTLSVEVEYLANPYYGRKYLAKNLGGSNFSPLPYIDNYSALALPEYDRDDWKWSVFAHKALNSWVDLKVRLANDHLRLRNWDGDYEGGEPLTKVSGDQWYLLKGDWYLMARIEFHN
jgi:hypothetical protein